MVQRIEEILGTTITEYTLNAIKFRGLSLETLQQHTVGWVEARDPTHLESLRDVEPVVNW